MYDFFILRFPFTFIESFKLGSSRIALVSDSETAFLRFENRFRIICFSLLIIFFLSVCLFNLMYHFVCLCGLITSSYLSSLIIQLCITIVCLFPRLFFDIRF